MLSSHVKYMFPKRKSFIKDNTQEFDVIFSRGIVFLRVSVLWPEKVNSNSFKLINFNASKVSPVHENSKLYYKFLHKK